MKRKNLEKAIILGLMAASISVPVWAADQISGPIKDGTYIRDTGIIIDGSSENAIEITDSNDKVITVQTNNMNDGDIKITSNQKGVYIDYDNNSNRIVDIISANDVFVDISNNDIHDGTIYKAIDINDGQAVITGSGDFTATVKSSSSIVQGLYTGTGNSSITVDVNGLANIDTEGTSSIAINANYGNIQVLADEGIRIKAVNNEGNNVINADAQGIMAYNFGNSESDTNVVLQTKGDIVIDVINNNKNKDLIDGSISYGVGVCGASSDSDTKTLLSGNNVDINIINSGAEQSIGIGSQDLTTGNTIFIGTATNEFKIDIDSSVGVSRGIETAQGQVEITAYKTTIDVSSDGEEGTAVYSGGTSPNTPVEDKKNNVIINSHINDFKATTNGVFSEDKAVVEINATDTNSIDAGQYGIIADTGSKVIISGNTNKITTDGNRTIFAEGVKNGQQSEININGGIYIANKNATGDVTKLNSDNNSQIAIVASADENSQDKDALGGIVNIDLKGTNTYRDLNTQEVKGNVIYGSIIAGQNGTININTNLSKQSTLNSSIDNDNKGSVSVYGNILAGNGGELNLDIGKGGYLEGRADDYRDADTDEWSVEHSNQFAPEFSKEVSSSGTVNLYIGEGAVWNVTGQSWVTSVNSNGGIIDLTNNETGEGNHAIHIGNLEGENTFRVNLSTDGSGNMIYIKDGTTAHQNLDIANKTDVLNSMKVGEEIRFATIANSKGGFGENTKIRDAGIMNVDFDIVYKQIDEDDHQKDDDYNDSYNGGSGDNGSIGENKPGTGYVEDNYNIDENSYNVYIMRQGGGDISDPGKTVVNMSKVNYSNAVYMDRLNKRLGEARYINTEEDQGMWVRMRHDRIGKDNEFRIMNTMYELGYDEKQECDNGERRVGAAIDYMDGSSEYTGVGGSGDVSRKGIWLYDTWLGDKGHYSDFVAKWGHLSNDFTLYRGGDKITGDFSNNVYSISAEYGRKKDIGNNWYFEPQVQLQYARVTDANYTTSQGTEVSLDAINSLIARAGFRLGKDLGERSTVYFKADLLHEFLGDQDIYATDGTGTMDVTYGNEGTWCDIGFGFATAMSKTSYAYLDVETSLGNDYEETYQINAGLQWSF